MKSKTKQKSNSLFGVKSTSSSQHPIDDPNVEVVVYKKPRKKYHGFKKESETPKSEPESPNVKQLKLDVYRLLARNANASALASSSGEVDSKVAAKHALAIALGAEPPKRGPFPLKQYQAELKQRQEKERELQILNRISNAKVGKKSDEKRRKKSNKSSRGNGNGKGLNFGSWKGGVLRLSKEHVQRVKTSKSLKL